MLQWEAVYRQGKSKLLYCSPWLNCWFLLRCTVEGRLGTVVNMYRSWTWCVERGTRMKELHCCVVNTHQRIMPAPSHWTRQGRETREWAPIYTQYTSCIPCLNSVRNPIDTVIICSHLHSVFSHTVRPSSGSGRANQWSEQVDHFHWGSRLWWCECLSW